MEYVKQDHPLWEVQQGLRWKIEALKNEKKKIQRMIEAKETALRLTLLLEDDDLCKMIDNHVAKARTVLREKEGR